MKSDSLLVNSVMSTPPGPVTPVSWLRLHFKQVANKCSRLHSRAGIQWRVVDRVSASRRSGVCAEA